MATQEQIARWLSITLDQRKRAVNQFEKLYGVNWAGRTELLKEIQEIENEIRKPTK